MNFQIFSMKLVDSVHKMIHSQIKLISGPHIL